MVMDDKGWYKPVFCLANNEVKNNLTICGNFIVKYLKKALGAPWDAK